MVATTSRSSICSSSHGKPGSYETHPNDVVQAAVAHEQELSRPFSSAISVARAAGDYDACVRRLAVCAVALALLPAANAAAATSSSYFETPSKNIVCGYASGGGQTELQCGIVSGLHPPGPKPKGGCHGIDPASNRLELSPTGRPAGFCSGDAGVFARVRLAPVLAYGQTWHKGAYSCSSATNGVTCRNGAGNGFFLSRASWHSL
jgi:hypothetical protein